MFAVAAFCTPAAPVGLYVQDGAFYFKGERIKAYGINFYDALLRSYPAADKRGASAYASVSDALKVLAKYKIPFIRFSCFPYYPVDWELYFKDKAAYYAKFDALVKAAEKEGVGLIPSIFWTHFTLADIFKEDVSALENPASKTRTFMRLYAVEIVNRYKKSSAIWAWEFGNEYMLHADLPNVNQGLPPTISQLGTPATRGAKDKITSGGVINAYAEFAKLVRALDKTRPIMSGDSLPRFAAWHLANEKKMEARQRGAICGNFGAQRA